MAVFFVQGSSTWPSASVVSLRVNSDGYIFSIALSNWGLLTLIKSSIYRRVNSNDLACGWPFVLETGSWHYFRCHAKEVQLRAGRNLYP